MRIIFYTIIFFVFYFILKFILNKFSSANSGTGTKTYFSGKPKGTIDINNIEEAEFKEVKNNKRE
jgi:hypothetical protein